MSAWTEFFDELHRIYRQSSQLLRDTDRLLSEAGFTCAHKTQSQIGTELSYSLEQPDRWYARWVARFYSRVGDERVNPHQVLAFVAIFLSDENGEGDWASNGRLEEPLVVAGAMGPPARDKPIVWSYWHAKHWFWWDDTKVGGQITRVSDLAGYADCWSSMASFAVPLAEIDGIETLSARVITPLRALLAEESSKVRGTSIDGAPAGGGG